MFPFLIGFNLLDMLGLLGLGSVGDSQSSTHPFRYQDYQVDDAMIKLIAQHERNGDGSKPSNPSYTIPGERSGTIGFGSHTIVKSNGLDFTPSTIGNGVTLAQLKARMGYPSSMTDLQFAKELVYNYCKCKKVRNFFVKLDSQNISFYRPLADALVDWGYNSGSGWSSGRFNTMVTELKKMSDAGMLNAENGKKIAQLYIIARGGYLKDIGIGRQTSNFWRTLVMAERIRGVNMDKYSLHSACTAYKGNWNLYSISNFGV